MKTKYLSHAKPKDHVTGSDYGVTGGKFGWYSTMHEAEVAAKTHAASELLHRKNCTVTIRIYSAKFDSKGMMVGKKKQEKKFTMK